MSNRTENLRSINLKEQGGSVIKCLLALLLCLTVISPSHANDGKGKPVKAAVKDHPLKEIWSGYHYIADDIRKMQDDPIRNPGNAWKAYGADLWKKVEGDQKKSCASCHNKAEASMKRVGSRYPLYHEARQTLINLEDRINLCRTKFMKAPQLSKESNQMLGLSIYVKSQSANAPIKVRVTGPAKPYFDKGKKIYYTRRGQLNMSCASCHEQNAGKQLRASVLSQGQSNGYPAYSISQEKPGSLAKRINQCSTLIRATPLFSDDIKSLELYLSWRGEGLSVETPAVRR